MEQVTHMGELTTAIQRMEDLKEDDRIPSNVKNAIDRCLAALQDDDEDLSVRINTATSILDEVSNDPNLAQHTRTEVWNIASTLESVDNNQ